jgi:hypothetical protein
MFNKKYFSTGEFSDEEDMHVSIAKECQNPIVEIGVFKGRTSRLLSLNAKTDVYGIDPLVKTSLLYMSIAIT